jgi:YegS C-terminal NAD kinase beta sandwich-like domain
VIRRGEPWGSPAGGPPVAAGAGGDADLAELVQHHPGGRLGFRPDRSCDLARAVGLPPAGGGEVELPLDAIALDEGRDVAVNLVVAGRPPDRLRWWHRRRPGTVRVDGRLAFDGRATTVVVANGQFRAGVDLVPRGHPGDGRLEVQVYAVPPGQRRALRRRLRTGTHLPHPGVVTASGRRVEVRWRRDRPVEADGRRLERRASLDAAVVPAAYTLLV